MGPAELHLQIFAIQVTHSVLVLHKRLADTVTLRMVCWASLHQTIDCFDSHGLRRLSSVQTVLLPLAISTSVLSVMVMVSCNAGAPEAQEAQQVAVHAHNLEAQAHAHAEAQVQAAVQAHSLAAKAQAHAHAQVRPITARPPTAPIPNMLAAAAATRQWLVSLVSRVLRQ